MFKTFRRFLGQRKSNMKKLLAPKVVCDSLGVCRRSLARYEQQGLIRPIKINSRVFRYDPEDIEALVEKLKGEAA